MSFPTGLLIFAAIVLLIIAGALVLLHRVQNVSQTLFGTKSLTEGWKRQEEALASTPKSVSGMTRIYEPQIQRDFPEFNWLEFKNKAENMLRLAFLAIEQEDSSQLKDASGELEHQVKTQISQNQAERVREHYQNVKIHDTQITRYEKKQGTCIITLQSAVGHRHYKEKDAAVIQGDDRLDEQTKYNVEILYVQNPELAGMDRAVSMSCPNCGAPVTSLGNFICAYCGSEVTPIHHQVWSLHKFYEVTYHNI